MLIYQSIIPCHWGSSGSLVSYQLSNWFSLLSREVPLFPSDVGPLFSGYWFFFLSVPHCFRGRHPSEDFLRKMYIELKCQKMSVFYLANTGSVFAAFHILDHLYGACFLPFLELLLSFWKFIAVVCIFYLIYYAGFSVGHFSLDTHVLQVQKVFL